MKSTQSNKKAAARHKLKTFEWTEDDIEVVSAGGVPKHFPISSSIPSELQQRPVDTMENKIARVQERKKEAEVRAIKYSALQKKNGNRNNPLSLEKYYNSVLGNNQKTSTTVIPDINNDVMSKLQSNDYFLLAEGLNQYFDEFVARNSLCSVDESSLLLQMYDSSDYSELIKYPDLAECPFEGVCLLSSTQVETNNYRLGQWFPCIVFSAEIQSNVNIDSLISNLEVANLSDENEVSPSNNLLTSANAEYYQVMTPHNKQSFRTHVVNIFTKHRVQMNFNQTESAQSIRKSPFKQSNQLVLPDNADKLVTNYINRVIQAIQRRHDAVSLMKYYYHIECIPFNRDIVSSINRKTIETIRKRAVSTKLLIGGCPNDCLSSEIDQV